MDSDNLGLSNAPPLYIVTGGGGFIGSNLVARLVNKGADIVVSDYVYDHTHDHHDSHKDKNLSKHAICAFISPQNLIKWLDQHIDRKPRAVFHIGASSSTTVTNVEYLRKNNIKFSQTMWNWCTHHHVDLVYASSAATYGDGSHGFDDDPLLLNRLRPLNHYGNSKHIFDLWATKHANSDVSKAPPHWYGMKFFNVFGPNEYHKHAQSSVIPHWVNQIQQTGRARLFQSGRLDIQDGQQQRDFVHVDDCINHMLELLENGCESGIYNSATGQARSFEILANLVYKAMHKQPDIEYVLLPDNLKEHYQYFTQATMHRYENITGQKAATVSFAERVRSYVCDYLLAKDQYR